MQNINNLSQISRTKAGLSPLNDKLGRPVIRFGDADYGNEQIENLGNGGNDLDLTNFDITNATVTGGVSIVSNAIDFNGSTGYLTIPNTTDYSGSNWSISAKVRFSVFPTSGNNDVLFSQGNGAGTGATWLYINNTSGTITRRTGIAGVATTFTGLTAPVVGTDYNVTLTKTGTTLTLYVNGESSSITKTMASATGNIFLGTNNTATIFFDGTMDYVRFYTKALTASEVASESALTTPSSFNDLLYEYRGDSYSGTESAPTSITDIVSGNNAIVTGGVTIINYAIDFDGTTGYLTVANSTDYSASDWSVCLEVYFDVAATGIIISQQDGSGTGRVMLSREGSSNKFGSGIGGTFSTFSTLSNAFTTTRLKVCLVKSGTSLTLYHDGGTETKTVTMESATGDFIIGANKLLGDKLNGKIRNLRFYTKALSAGEVTAEQDALPGYSTITDGSLILEISGLHYAGTESVPTLIYDTYYTVLGASAGTQAIVFDGVDDYIEPGSMSYVTQQNLSMSCKFKLNVSDTSVKTLMKTNYYNLWIRNSDNTIQLRFDNGAARVVPFDLGAGDLDWHSVVATMQDSGSGITVSLWVDGVLRASTARGFYAFNVVTPTIGGSAYGGCIQDPRLYSRVLQPREIQALSN